MLVDFGALYFKVRLTRMAFAKQDILKFEILGEYKTFLTLNLEFYFCLSPNLNYTQ